MKKNTNEEAVKANTEGEVSESEVSDDEISEEITEIVEVNDNIDNATNTMTLLDERKPSNAAMKFTFQIFRNGVIIGIAFTRHTLINVIY